ncbi:MAG: molybdopterin molybdotransferase MoeA [Arenimonas sp.]|nr:molybdopterin molybdotransferase MoeA [Arenimonas sp.]
MIAFAEARSQIISACKKSSSERLPVTQVLGRVLAEDLYSPANLPPFDNSAMDGFALRSNGLRIAKDTQFYVTGAVAAGDDARAAIADGACEIMTGAPVPKGFDAIIPVEQIIVLEKNCDGRPLRIQLQAEVQPNAHIRYAGEDVSTGSRILKAGSPIGASERMLLTGLGIADVAVQQQPRIAVITTGHELVDDPYQELRPGQIRNSNGPFLADRIRQCGAQLCLHESITDDTDEFLKTLDRGVQACADIIISTGAVSMGRYDFVPDALRTIGATIVFHKVAMRPGKPLLFALLPNGSLYFGLPGNPISSAVGFRFFVQLAIETMQGLQPEQAITLPLAHPVDKKPGFTLLQKARVDVEHGGQLSVSLLKGQESFLIQPLLQSNAWALLPEQVNSLAQHELVDIYGLHTRGMTLSGQENSDGN